MMNPLESLLTQLEEQNLWQEEIELNRNAFLCRAGQIKTNLYYVLEGSLRVYLIDEDEEHTIRFGYANSFLGALDSFVSEQPSNYYIETLKKTRLKVVSKETFMKLVEGTTENLEAWHKILAQLIVQQMEREHDLLTSYPKARYDRVFKRSPQLFQEIPSKYIASYLRMTPETLSRLKNIDFNQ